MGLAAGQGAGLFALKGRSRRGGHFGGPACKPRFCDGLQPSATPRGSPKLIGLARRGYPMTMRTLKFIVEKHSDGYLAYPLGLKGVVIGQGDSYEEALADAKSAASFHIETFGSEVLDDDSDVQAAYVAEAAVA